MNQNKYYRMIFPLSILTFLLTPDPSPKKGEGSYALQNSDYLLKTIIISKQLLSFRSQKIQLAMQRVYDNFSIPIDKVGQCQLPPVSSGGI